MKATKFRQYAVLAALVLALGAARLWPSAASGGRTSGSAASWVSRRNSGRTSRRSSRRHQPTLRLRMKTLDEAQAQFDRPRREGRRHLGDEPGGRRRSRPRRAQQGADDDAAPDASKPDDRPVGEVYGACMRRLPATVTAIASSPPTSANRPFLRLTANAECVSVFTRDPRFARRVRPVQRSQPSARHSAQESAAGFGASRPDRAGSRAAIRRGARRREHGGRARADPADRAAA